MMVPESTYRTLQERVQVVSLVLRSSGNQVRDQDSQICEYVLWIGGFVQTSKGYRYFLFEICRHAMALDRSMSFQGSFVSPDK
jgi:hypothetical protein